MKYIHCVSFVTNITGEKINYIDISSNNQKITITELKKAMNELLLELNLICEYRFGICNISTVLNK